MLIAVVDIPVGTLCKFVLTSDLMEYLSREHAERFYFFRIGLVHRYVRGVGTVRGKESGVRGKRRWGRGGWTKNGGPPRAAKCLIARPDPILLV